MTVVSRRQLVLALQARADGVANAAKFLSEAVDVPKKSDGGGAVVPYLVMHPFGGAPTSEVDLGESVVDLDWLFQITVASGDPEDLPALIDRVDARFYRWIPTVTGLECGPCKPPPGYEPGPVQVDRDQSPHRYFVPLQYGTTVTAT